MLQGILAARLLGVTAFGVLGSITSFTSIVNKFISFRMGELVVKYVGHYSEHDDHAKAAAVFKLAALVEILASFLAFGLVWVLATLGARYLAKDPSATGLFHTYSFIILANMVFWIAATRHIKSLFELKEETDGMVSQEYMSKKLLMGAGFGRFIDNYGFPALLKRLLRK